jgi:hypothetical protein
VLYSATKKIWPRPFWEGSRNSGVIDSIHFPKNMVLIYWRLHRAILLLLLLLLLLKQFIHLIRWVE